jgi:NAD(P)-dependent dehydrogenase (short-subunit alcohol dehydrogenase family)
MSADRPLAGRHAVITGGGRGIGRAVAAELAALGASVVLLGRSAEALAEAAAELSAEWAGDRTTAQAPRVSSVVASVADAAAVRDAFADIRRRHGDVDILVNNAGVAPAARVTELTEADWEEAFAVNVTGAWRCMKEVLPAMMAKGQGRIVNVASSAGLRGYAGVAAYVASKHALVGLTRAAALEVASRGVTVNAVCPGYTDTDMAQAAIDNLVRERGLSIEEARARLVRGLPIGRLIRPEEVATVVGWLCGADADSVTGQAIAVAGGEV